jgi:hypothetical protein
MAYSYHLGWPSYTHWRDDDSKAWSKSITFGGHLSFCWAYSNINHHGEKYTDDSPCGYSYKTVIGWQLKCLQLKHESAGASYRLILYYPTGAWRHWDIYITVSRRYKTTKGFLRSMLRAKPSV